MPTLRSTAATLLYLSANLFTLATTSPDAALHNYLHKRASSQTCYSSSAPLTFNDTYTYQSSGHCETACTDAGQNVAATTNGGDCWCGDEYPAEADIVDASNCNVGCQGYNKEMCGGDGFWSVYPALNGAVVSNYGGSSTTTSTTSSSAASTTAKPTVITSAVAGGATVFLTVEPTATSASTSDPSSASTSNKSSGGSNTAGIAAGVVVGVVAVAAIGVGLFFFLRHKKRKDAEQDFKQRTQVADFMRGSNERKPPGTGYSGMSDQRLDPEAGRRNSVGSLADNQDYSRRILRVANPT